MGNIEDRKSIRKYKKKKVEREKIEAVLTAGLQAPYPKTSWWFVVISDEKKKQELVVSMRNYIHIQIKENHYVLSCHVKTVVKLILKKDTPKIKVTMKPNANNCIDKREMQAG